MSYCTSCGASVPNGQRVCSMCYGDPDYGSDGYYRDYIEEQLSREAELEQLQRQEEDYGESQAVELEDPLYQE